MRPERIRFDTFARAAQQSDDADGLEAATHGAFGPLFQTPKAEAGVLRETLNDRGRQVHDDWEPLKVDNRIDPKITWAFGKALKTGAPTASPPLLVKHGHDGEISPRMCAMNEKKTPAFTGRRGLVRPVEGANWKGGISR